MPADANVSLARLRGLWELHHGGVVWRHDVDYDTLCAALMARHEEEAGIVSVYFVRLRSPEYNVFSAEVREHMEEILECGHTIGLHLDTGLAREAKVEDLYEIGEQAAEDLLFLMDAIPAVEPFVSYHAPPHDLRGRVPHGEVVSMGQHLRFADGSEWKDRYIADSRGVWREPPEPRLREGGPLMVNTHPEWYFLPEPERSILWEREQRAP